jgi:hypothetical protein
MSPQFYDIDTSHATTIGEFLITSLSIFNLYIKHNFNYENIKHRKQPINQIILKLSSHGSSKSKKNIYYTKFRSLLLIIYEITNIVRGLRESSI